MSNWEVDTWVGIKHNKVLVARQPTGYASCKPSQPTTVTYLGTVSALQLGDGVAEQNNIPPFWLHAWLLRLNFG